MSGWRAALIGAVAASAQMMASGALAAPNSPSPAAADLARRVILAVGLPEAFTQPSSNFQPSDLDVVIERHPEVRSVTPERRAAIFAEASEAAVTAVSPGYVDRIASHMAGRYDEADLAALAAYFDSPVGRSVTAKQGALDAAVAAVAAQLAPTVRAGMRADLCQGSPRPVTPSLASPADPLAHRVASQPGYYRAGALSAKLDHVALADSVRDCGAAGSPPSYVAATQSAIDETAKLAPAYWSGVEAAYARVLTAGELKAMADFEDSAAGRRFATLGVPMPPAGATVDLELKAQFAIAACERLGCRTPPDQPRLAWAAPSPEKLALARKEVSIELGDLDSEVRTLESGFAGDMGKAGLTDRERAIWEGALKKTLRSGLPALVDATTDLYAEAYSNDELKALAEFDESPIGRTILVTKRQASAKFSPPAYSDAQKTALEAFDASPAGVSIHDKRKALFAASALLNASLSADFNEVFRANYCAAGGACAGR
jgi:hypothetical protein